MDRTAVTVALKAAAQRLGFAPIGVCPAIDAPGFERLQTWLDRGYAGQMDYLARRLDAYRHPSSVLPGARSLLLLGLIYRSDEPVEPPLGSGRVSRYAWSEVDYHDVVHDRLRSLIAELRTLAPDAQARGVIDTAPLLERDFARLAGLGWIGKHTLLINRQSGSWMFLAALLTDLELDADEPFEADHCGSCRACLEACPTRAFPEPYVLDASRCISYLTIEHRGPIPIDLRPGVGDWLFGCDVCQEVCPWNRRAPLSAESTWKARPDRRPLELTELFELDDEEFRVRFRRTPLGRPKRRGLLRNAAVVLGNQRADHATPALIRGLNDAEPDVRGAAAWALGRIGGEAARQALLDRRSRELDPQVQAEIAQALAPDAASSRAPTDEESPPASS